MRQARTNNLPASVWQWPEEEPQTLAASAYDMLRRGILNCHYGPGTRLRLDALRKQSGFGFSPLREALSRLTGEGLVEQEGQRGFRVAPVSIDDLLDIAAIRCEVEIMALRQSMTRGDDAWETGVAATAHHLALISAQGARAGSPQSDEWGKRHGAFHLALVSACGSPRLLAIREQLYELSERYRRLLYAHGVGPRNVDEEHRSIAEAVIHRNTETACALLSAHIRTTVDNLTVILERETAG